MASETVCTDGRVPDKIRERVPTRHRASTSM